MDQQVLGKKIKQLREKSGLTQEEAEKAIGLPQKALTHIESGVRKVSTLELAKLSELFHVPIGDFFAKEVQEEDLLVALHRIAPGLESNPKVHDQVAKCIQICREGVFLKNVLGLSHQHTIRTYSCSFPKDVQEAIKQGEDVAREERRGFELGDAPIYDIAEMLSSQGIWTAQTMLPDEMSGLFLHHAVLGMAIIVNANHVRSRQRFSYAHEYAHALFDAKRMITISNTDNSGDLIEVRANAFASAFLMPQQGIANLLRSMGKGEGSRVDLAIYDASTESAIEAKYRQTASSQKITSQAIAWVAHHFGVSYQATVYRLQNLGYFTAKEGNELLKDKSKGKAYLRVWHHQDVDITPEHASRNRELKAQIAYLATEAFQREEISRGRLLDLSKLLELSGKELLQLAESERVA
jgi:Zn-dependent peptidase ImmA (M78 family)/transcriptional regulator with XRE-family HTH domain